MKLAHWQNAFENWLFGIAVKLLVGANAKA